MPVPGLLLDVTRTQRIDWRFATDETAPSCRALMATSYIVNSCLPAPSSVLSLPLGPQNDFQKAFWKLRASEQESYNLQYEPLKPKVVRRLYTDNVLGRGAAVGAQFRMRRVGGWWLVDWLGSAHVLEKQSVQQQKYSAHASSRHSNRKRPRPCASQRLCPLVTTPCKAAVAPPAAPPYKVSYVRRTARRTPLPYRASSRTRCTSTSSRTASSPPLRGRCRGGYRCSRCASHPGCWPSLVTAPAALPHFYAMLRLEARACAENLHMHLHALAVLHNQHG